MRDQRMLRCLETLPRRTKVVLRNSLTRRFPAVPLPSSVLSNQSVDDNDEKKSKNDNTKNTSLKTEYDIDIGDNLTYMGKKTFPHPIEMSKMIRPIIILSFKIQNK